MMRHWAPVLYYTSFWPDDNASVNTKRMTSKAKELNVDELLNEVDARDKVNKVNKDTKAVKKDDWEDTGDDNLGLGIVKEGGSKNKNKPKKTQDKGWADVEAEKQQQQPKVVDFTKIQAEEDKKKKIINKPGQTKAAAAASIDINQEYFPGLGEERPKHQKKPEPVQAPQPEVVKREVATGGPKKFVNAKKQNPGESFAPIEPPVAVLEKPIAPVVAEKTETKTETKTEATTTTTATAEKPKYQTGVFSRRTDEPKETKETKETKEPEPAPADSKFKFGGDGPKKFVTGAKISFKREEEKNDLEALRLQREREIEEKLLREKEELAKQRELREQKKAKEGGEHKNGKTNENTEKPAEKKEGQDEKKVARFSNAKKEAEKPVAPAVTTEKPAVVTEVVSEKPGHHKETIEMHGSLSNKAWGDGPILKKPQKK